MAKIGLISCASKKKSEKSKAKDLYISTLFKYNLKYMKTLNPDKTFILSAKYGLLELEKEIEPYNKTLNKMSSKEIKLWSDLVISQLKKESNLNTDEFIFLAGEKYRKFLIPNMKNFIVPLKGLSIGKQLKELKRRLR